MQETKLKSPKIISDFYSDAEIFITGGSGVVGKALIYKLLCSCNVRRIYLLMREKKKQSIEERLENIKTAKIFDALRNTQKQSELNKLVPIAGDVALSNLGIKSADAQRMKNVTAIIHCAATVRFDEPLKVALKLNVGGTYEALQFAETLKKLKIFMHVSTFFSNPQLSYIEPKLYEAPMDWRTALKLLKEEHLENATDILTPKLITHFPNTYTFTKNLAESLVNDFRHRLPVAIFRPSIVIFALCDPVPGFPPSIMGATGLFAAVAAGILKTVFLNPKIFFDLTPLDVCSNVLIYYTAASANISNRAVLDAAPVYLCSSAIENTHTFQELVDMPEKNNLWERTPLLKNFLIPGCHYTHNRVLYLFLVITKQLLPALLVDALICLAGRKPVMMGLMRKSFNSLQVMEHFLVTNYSSPGYTDVETMKKHIKGTDFDIWDGFALARTEEGLKQIVESMIFKIRDVLMNEEPETLQKARNIMRIKKYIYNGIRMILAYFMLRYFYNLISSYIFNS